MPATYILDKDAIDLKLRRLALEIAERNTDTEKIVLAGIAPNGVVMAKKLKNLLADWFKGTIEELSIALNKKHPETVALNGETNFENAVVIIVDDVANSGKTLSYALKPFLSYFPKKIQTLVLVDRKHKGFPVQPDYIGYTLCTSLQDYIDVAVKDGELVAAWVE